MNAATLPFNARHWSRLALAGLVFSLLYGCSTPPPPSPYPGPSSSSGSTAPPPPRAGGTAAASVSQARTPMAYRRDAAQHLYALQAKRIYKGRLPPLLYAVGVLNVEIDRRGQVLGLHWMRAPQHAPEVMREIEAIVRAAAPYPAPQHLSKVTYTDVWLWHKSGLFQLDTLTEGQD